MLHECCQVVFIKGDAFNCLITDGVVPEYENGCKNKPVTRLHQGIEQILNYSNILLNLVGGDSRGLGFSGVLLCFS